MKDDLLIQLALRFAIISLLSVGGSVAALPEAHRVIVSHFHWMNDEQFSQTFALAQTSPGPNVIVFSLFGWQLAGLAGIVVATLAILGPSSLLAFGVARVMGQSGEASWPGRLKKGLAPLAIGLLAANGYLLALGADADLLGFAVTAAAAAFVVFTRRSPLYAIAAGAALFVAARRLGLIL